MHRNARSRLIYDAVTRGGCCARKRDIQPRKCGSRRKLANVLDLEDDLGEIQEEPANSPAVTASGFRIKGSAERIDGAIESRSQRMLKWRTPDAVHDEVTGGRWIRLDTARAY